MSKRINSHFKTSTSQIITILDKNELSFRELVWNLAQDEKTLSRDIKTLVADGIIDRKFDHNNVVYTRAPHSPIVQILHTLSHHYDHRS